MTSTLSTPAVATPDTSTPNSRPTTPLSTPPSVALSDKPQDDSSKLRLLVSLLRKFIGVADISAVRFSLPAQLIEPIPNLDRADAFAAIGKSDDDVGRMLEVLRYWFTKDLKYIKGKPIKPYNSVLGEFFRCNWEVTEEPPPIDLGSKNAPADSTPSVTLAASKEKPVIVSYVTEQTSHHPPVSAYWAECPERGLYLRGYDQINAKFTGMSVKVTSANYNHGIFINNEARQEEYQMTHPAAYLSGLFKTSLYIVVVDTCFVTCPKTRLKAILEYSEVGWMVSGKKNIVSGVIFRYEPENDKYNNLKDVPEKEVLVRLEGVWQEQIYYWTPTKDSKYDKKGPPSDAKVLINLVPLMPSTKLCPPLEQQLPNESRNFWKDLTAAIQEKRFGDANKVKQDIEQRQRDKAADRSAKNVIWKPRFFTEVAEDGGQPHLSQDGKDLLAGMQKNDFQLKEPVSVA